MASMSTAPLPSCENCRQPARSCCGRCRSVPICSRECMAAVWPAHKAECKNIVETKRLVGTLGRTGGEQHECVGFMSIDDLSALNQRSIAVYNRHNLTEPPPKGSTMATRKKLAFFLDMLREHDSSSDANRGLPLGVKLLLNRRFNNTYRHAVETSGPGELDRLNAMMRANHVGAEFH